MKRVLFSLLLALAMPGCSKSTTNYVWPTAVKLGGSYRGDVAVTVTFDGESWGTFDYPATRYWVGQEAGTVLIVYWGLGSIGYADYAESEYSFDDYAYVDWFGIVEHVTWTTYADPEYADLYAAIEDTAVTGEPAGNSTWDYEVKNIVAEGAASAQTGPVEFRVTVAGQERITFSDRRAMNAYVRELLRGVGRPQGDPLGIVWQE